MKWRLKKENLHSEAEEEKNKEFKGKRLGNSTKKKDHDSTVNEEPERTIIKEDMMKNHMPPPFPQALHSKKGINNASEILEVLRQVKVNIPLLDMIKQVLTYAKFMKDLCTIKRGSGCPTISVMIGGVFVEKALLDLGASVNLLPYSIYKQLGLGELKPTSITLSLADRSVKIPRGMIEDVLVQVDKFYYPVDFVVRDTDPVAKGTNCVPIILGRPFLAPSNVIINCRNGIMQLTFDNMMLELNIFYLCKKQFHPEEEEGPKESLGEIDEGLPKPSDLLATLPLWKTREEILPLFKEDENQEAVKEESPKPFLKPLPTELKYAYLEENKQSPVVISSSLTTPQGDCLLEVLKRCKKAIGWKISDLKEISPLAGIVYPISNSPWVSPTQVVPKKSRITVVQNDKGEEVSTRLTSGWRVCIDYRKLNVVTRKDHFPLSFIDQMLERVSGHPFYCFLDDYSGRRPLLHAHSELTHTEECLSAYAMHPQHSKDAC
ncbi:hypothetical protein AAG906_010537 [Vitis piasezkii]